MLATFILMAFLLSAHVLILASLISFLGILSVGNYAVLMLMAECG